MTKSLLTFLALLVSAQLIFAQPGNSFPQSEINNALQNAFAKKHPQPNSQSPQRVQQRYGENLTSLLQQMDAVKHADSPMTLRTNQTQQTLTLDTLIVGLVPNDTVRITGNWTHTGPIWVFNDGVLIFDNATVADTGDVYVFGTGQLLADSSTFYFPQNYFYERSLLIVQNGYARFDNSSFNYSGMSHNLVLGDHGALDWNNVHQHDWTTCGLFGSPVIHINGCNLSGEYILEDSCTAVFNHADSIILWHQLPSTAVVNYAFPAGTFVNSYTFNNTTPGVSGITYNVQLDSSATVWWALMPVNGSDVTLSNSDIRLIGAWFQRGDVAAAHGIFNNSTYSNYITPLADRNLHLINSTVGTWSMYVFDSSYVAIDSCQLGEVGTQQHSHVDAQNFILDGTGGYFWATDTSATIAANVISYSTTRSEKNAIFILGYSWLPFSPPTSIANSMIVCVQNDLVSDPVPYDGSVAWLATMEQPDTASVNAVFPLTGSAWINQGPNGNPVDFGSYSMYWQLPSVSATWHPIITGAMAEVSHSTLALWNTNSYTPGTYILKLVLKNNFGDSVEGMKLIELLPNPAGIHEAQLPEAVAVYPNPSSGNMLVQVPGATGELVFYNTLGEVVLRKTITGELTAIDLSAEAKGIYIWIFSDGANTFRTGRVVVK